MGISAVLLMSFLSFNDPSEYLLLQRNEGLFEIKILNVPAFQSRIISLEKQGGGGVSGAVIGGNVTANFPEGYIVLKTSSDADYGEIQRIIKKKRLPHSPAVVESLPK